MISAEHVADELLVRNVAMAYVQDRAERSGGVISRRELEGFTVGGQQLKLIDQSRGIRTPRQLAATISILSQPKGPYDDVDTADGLLRYAYRSGPSHGSDNRKLRTAHELGLPLISAARYRTRRLRAHLPRLRRRRSPGRAVLRDRRRREPALDFRYRRPE